MQRWVGILLVGAVGLASACGEERGGTEDQAASTASTPSGGSPAQRAVGDVLAKAVEATRGARTARVAVVTEAQQGSDGSRFDVKLSGDGVVDFVSGNASFTMRLPTGQNTEVRQVDGVQHRSLPAALADRLPKGKRWVRTDAKASADFLSSPGSGLELLEGVAGEVRETGSEQVRGAETTRYETRADLTKLAGAAGEGKATPPPGLKLSDVPLTLWVDGEQRLRRLRLDLPTPMLAQPDEEMASAAPSGAPSGSAQVTVTQELYDFGVPVEVPAPARDEVLDRGELAKVLPRPSARPSTPSSPSLRS